MKNEDWEYLRSLLLESELEEVAARDTVLGPFALVEGDHPDQSGILGTPGSERWESGTSHYEAVQRLASGGVGEVWEGLHPGLARKIALKRIRHDVFSRAKGPRESRRLESIFRQEALITAALEHPNIVPVYDLGVDPEKRPALCMKLIRGKNWDCMIGEDMQGRSVDDFLDKHIPILIAVSNAVAFAHSHGIVHRDLKPSQVMVGDYGEVLLADWGLAMVFSDELFGEANPYLAARQLLPTRANALNPSGTPAYMAPEQLDKNARGIGPWTDVFLLGGILYQLLTGATPHRPKGDLRQQALACKITRPSERTGMADIPPKLEELCLAALQKEPSERIGSAQEFARELHEYLTRAEKRRLSVTMSQEIEKRLPQIGKDYDELVDCESTLTRATGLWAGNRRAEMLRQVVLRKFADAALERDDLSLAKLQATRITSAEIRQELLNEIHAHEQLDLLAVVQAREAEEERKGERLTQVKLEELICAAIGAAAAGESMADFLEEAMKVLPKLNCSESTMRLVEELRK